MLSLYGLCIQLTRYVEQKLLYMQCYFLYSFLTFDCHLKYYSYWLVIAGQCKKKPVMISTNSCLNSKFRFTRFCFVRQRQSNGGYSRDECWVNYCHSSVSYRLVYRLGSKHRKSRSFSLGCWCASYNSWNSSESRPSWLLCRRPL